MSIHMLMHVCMEILGTKQHCEIPVLCLHLEYASGSNQVHMLPVTKATTLSIQVS